MAPDELAQADYWRAIILYGLNTATHSNWNDAGCCVDRRPYSPITRMSGDPYVVAGC